MDEQFLRVTKKELFYTAVMLGIKQLVNVVYDFPADEVLFDKELDEARKSLKKKKLLTESALDGGSLSFSLMVCAAFCATPMDCEIVDIDDHRATIYHIPGFYMLLECCDEEEMIAMWFTDKEKLYQYIKDRRSTVEGVADNGGIEEL